MKKIKIRNYDCKFSESIVSLLFARKYTTSDKAYLIYLSNSYIEKNKLVIFAT